MSKENDILARIAEKKENMSLKQQQLADYILQNYKTAAFQNSTKLARLAKVSGSTVIRFADELGYAGFPQMQAALHRIVQKEITTVDNFLSSDLPMELASKRDGFFHRCIESLHKAEKSISVESVWKAAEMLATARNVYIVGFQGSSFLAEYMSYFLSRIRKNVFRINTWGNTMFHMMPEEQGELDVALIFAFPRFAAMTGTLANFFHAHKVPIVCVSTVYQNHISEMADVSIGVDIEYRAYVDHMTPALYLAETLIEKASKLTPESSVQQLEWFEQFTKETQVFSS